MGRKLKSMQFSKFCFTKNVHPSEKKKKTNSISPPCNKKKPCDTSLKNKQWVYFAGVTITRILLVQYINVCLFTGEGGIAV